jgi:REP element-mobilizing transposase RayT
MSSEWCGTGALACGKGRKPQGMPQFRPVHYYHRNLPHIQKSDTPHFVTFRTKGGFVLTPDAMGLVVAHCLHDNGKKLQMHAFVVMSNHVHLLFTPLRNAAGASYSLAEILRGIKGSSARSINKLLNRRGPVWQDESFDRVMRSGEFGEKYDYIVLNPVSAGLCSDPNAISMALEGRIVSILSHCRGFREATLSTGESACATPF